MAMLRGMAATVVEVEPDLTVELDIGYHEGSGPTRLV